MSSIKETDRQSAASYTAPRVALADIESAIGAVYYTDGLGALSGEALSPEHIRPLGDLSICIVVMRNGFMVVGKSAPSSPENRDRYLQRSYAYEDCIRQLWPLMGFALRSKLVEPAR